MKMKKSSGEVPPGEESKEGQRCRVCEKGKGVSHWRREKEEMGREKGVKEEVIEQCHDEERKKRNQGLFIMKIWWGGEEREEERV